jgi:hypothetical protein
VDFSEARNLFGIIFQIPGAFMKICGLRVDIQEVQGPFCKVVEIKEFPDLIYNGKFRGPSPRCGGPMVHSGPRWTVGGADTGRGGALSTRGTWALGLAGAHWRGATGRGDTGNSIGCSLGRERQRGGRVTEGNGGGSRCAGERLARAKREAEH